MELDGSELLGWPRGVEMVEFDNLHLALKGQVEALKRNHKWLWTLVLQCLAKYSLSFYGSKHWQNGWVNVEPGLACITWTTSFALRAGQRIRMFRDVALAMVR